MKQYPNDNQKHRDAYGVIAKRYGLSERKVGGTAINAFGIQYSNIAGGFYETV